MRPAIGAPPQRSDVANVFPRQFLSSVQGDLSNVTAPPTFLAPSSVVEVGHCWAQRPAVFAAPAREADPEKRALLVLRLVLVALRSQLYIAGSPAVSIKKPLNAFLGEVFLASWADDAAKARTRLVAEQVSHHPPITAMHIADEANGVRADGYARVEMTFTGTVNIRQVGHVGQRHQVLLVPAVQAQHGVAEMDFSGEGYLSGRRNSFDARLFRADDPGRVLYRAAGVWSRGWTVTDARTGAEVERYDVEAPENAPAPAELTPRAEQDVWESRRAWGGVLDGMAAGDVCRVVAEKKRLEQAQRLMRRREAAAGAKWEPLFFRSLAGAEHDVFHRLAEGTTWPLCDEKTKGVWRVREDVVDGVKRPFRGELTPHG